MGLAHKLVGFPWRLTGLINIQSRSHQGLTRGSVRTKGFPRFLLAQMMEGEWRRVGTWIHSVRGVGRKLWG